MIDLIHSVINTPRTREKRRTREIGAHAKIGAKIGRKLKKPNEFSGFLLPSLLLGCGKRKKCHRREQDGRGMGGMGGMRERGKQKKVTI
jgi:hypothetical protein